MNVPVPQEKGLSSPLDRDTLADRDVVQVHLDLGQGKNVFGCRHTK